MATRFWVGGTGTWDNATTTHWSASSGGAGGQSVPGSADSVTFDGASGGGTVTLAFGGTITLLSLTWGAFTGTIDNSVNNNNITLTGATGFNGSGAGTRTFNAGSATYTLSATASAGASVASFTMSTTTGLTWNAGTSVITYSGNAAGLRVFAGGGLTYNNVTFAASAGGYDVTGANTYSALTVNAPLILQTGNTQTVTTLNVTGVSSAPAALLPATDSAGAQYTVSIAAGSPTIAWAGIRGGVFSGGATFAASNSLDLGDNTGITITAPSVGGGSGARMIGG